MVVSLLHSGFVKTNLDRSGAIHRNPEAVELGEAAGKVWEVLKWKGAEAGIVGGYGIAS